MLAAIYMAESANLAGDALLRNPAWRSQQILQVMPYYATLRGSKAQL